MSVKVARAGYEDLYQIENLWIALMKDHETMEPSVFKDTEGKSGYYYDKLVADYNDKENQRIFVLIDEDEPDKEKQIKGYICGTKSHFGNIYNSDPMGYLNDIYIDRAYQNKGYGRLLIDQLMDWFRENRILRVEVLVVSKNSNAIDLFKSYRFEPYAMLMNLQLESR